MQNYQNYHNPNDYWMPADADYEQRVRVGCLNLIVMAVATMAAFTICALLGSCATRRTVESNDHRQSDTLKTTVAIRDSIHILDSVYLHEYSRGETVFVERTRWLTRYRDRHTTDTLYRSRTDTVMQAYQTIQEVPVQPTPLHRLRIAMEDALAVAVMGVAIYLLLRRLKKPPET